MSFDEALTTEQLDADYTARDTVSPGMFDAIIGEYLALSQRAEAQLMSRPAVRYDPCAEVLDVLGAGSHARPAVFFIHGGYWRALSRAHSSYMAPMLAANGIVTVVPDYTLAPAATMTEIVRQMHAALAYVWHNASDLGIDRERIVVAGTSAGAHLAAALAVDGWQAAFGLPSQPLSGALPISGLFDLDPIRRAHPQAWLSLTETEVQALSPLRHVPEKGCPMVVALGEGETPGFVRQSAAFATAWSAAAPTRHLTIPGRNHFDVVLDLTDDTTALSKALLELCAA